MDQADEIYRESRDIWEDYNARQEFEHDLINRKSTWGLTTQAILFAAYGVALDSRIADEGIGFRNIIAGSGLAVAAVTFLGVIFVVRSKRLSWKEYANFYYAARERYLPPQPLNNRPLQWGVETGNTWLTLLPDILLPLIFAVAWMFALV
jgi:hypothetical protein